MKTKDLPTVSIIILTYNGKKYIKNCLNGVLDIEYPKEKYEVIVADNYSNDGTSTYVKQNFKNVKVIEFKKNYGFSIGNNIAVEYTNNNSKYFIFLNQDTIVHKKWLIELVKCIESDEKIGAAYSSTIHPNYPEFKSLEREKFPKNIYYLTMTKFYDERNVKIPFTSDCIETHVLSGATFIIRKDIIKKIGGLFDEDIFYQAEDTELSLRLYKFGYKIKMVPTSICYHFDEYRTNLEKKSIKKLIKLAKKTYIATKNRYTAFYKNLSLIKFIPVAGVITFTSFLKVNEFEKNIVKKFFYMIGAILLTFGAFLGFILEIKNIKKKI